MQDIVGVILGIFAGGLFIILIWAIVEGGNPSAMDVYRGKTTLEITYKDSIPIDSTVVWKDKIK